MELEKHSPATPKISAFVRFALINSPSAERETPVERKARRVPAWDPGYLRRYLARGGPQHVQATEDGESDCALQARKLISFRLTARVQGRHRSQAETGTIGRFGVEPVGSFATWYEAVIDSQ